MILHALHDLYERLEKDDAYEVAPDGYSIVAVSFLIELEPDGTARIRDHRIGDGNNRRGRPLCVPGPKAHTNAIDPFFLRDTATYLLGFKDNDPYPENTLQRFEASRKYHLSLQSTIDSDDYRAVCRFLCTWDPNQDQGDPKLFLNSGVFKMRSSSNYIHESPEVAKWWNGQQLSKKAQAYERMCLITGKRGPIALTHTPPIGGNLPSPAQAKATIVSFNFRAADSYGNDTRQGLNSPISEDAATKYCKSLNALLTSKKHRIQIGDATTVFWTETPTKFESVLPGFFSGELTKGTDESEDSQATNLLASLRNTLRSLRQGGEPDPAIENERKVPFYILGLTGQAGGRIGIRFWHPDTVGGLLEKLARHHRDLAIVRQWDSDPEFPSARRILDQTTPNKKGKPDRDRIPPNLGGALMRSILTGGQYPQMLATAVLNRVRVSENDNNKKPRNRVSYLRAAILKAFLNRNHKLDMTEALDTNRPEPAYHLGRLFAVFETAQRHAHDWKLERTIRETMYSSASATPLAVFGRLERLHHHHTAKKSNPRGSPKSYADIVADIEQHFRGTPLYPASLNLVGQSLFAVGYYHQLHFFQMLAKSSENKKKPEPKIIDRTTEATSS